MIDVNMDENGTIRVLGPADVQHAANLHAGLALLLQDRSDGFVLDLSGLTSVDIAGAQVLIAFKRAVPSLKVHSCPATVRQRLDQLSLLVLLA